MKITLIHPPLDDPTIPYHSFDLPRWTFAHNGFKDVAMQRHLYRLLLLNWLHMVSRCDTRILALCRRYKNSCIVTRRKRRRAAALQVFCRRYKNSCIVYPKDWTKRTAARDSGIAAH
jgi:hypothetical protein